MAIDARRPAGSTVIHSDQGTQYGSWAFTRRAQEAGLLPSMGAVGTCFDNALMESFWSRVQVELLVCSIFWSGLWLILGAGGPEDVILVEGTLRRART